MHDYHTIFSLDVVASETENIWVERCADITTDEWDVVASATVTEDHKEFWFYISPSNQTEFFRMTIPY